MKKKFLAVALSLSMALGTTMVTVGASETIEYDANDFQVNEQGVLEHYWGADAEVVIPDGITAIGDYAFMEYENITSVVIPDSVTSIGFNAFWCCTSLKSVNIPDSVTSIGVNAFYGCRSLTSITIPDSVTNIETNAFKVEDDTRDFEEYIIPIKVSKGSYAEEYAKENDVTAIDVETGEVLNQSTLPTTEDMPESADTPSIIAPTPVPVPVVPSTTPTDKPAETPVPSEPTTPSESEQPTPSETVAPTETTKPTETVEPSETPTTGGAVETDKNIDPITGKQYGDSDMDGDISLKDAQMALRVALRIDNADEDTIRVMSGGEDDVELKHAQKILRLALRIDNAYHE